MENSKFKARYSGTKYKLKRKMKWYGRYLEGRFFIEKLTIKYLIADLFSIISAIIGIILFLYMIGVVEYSNHYISFHNIIYLNKNVFEAKNIIEVQISVTLIVVSIVSLIASIDQKYIYGEKAIERISPKGNIIKLFFLLLLGLMMFNILALIKGYGDTTILIDFLSAIFIIMFVAYKFTSIFTNPKKYKEKLSILYFKENMRIIKDSLPLESKNSRYLNNLKVVTCHQVGENNPDYNDCIDLYLMLLDRCLFVSRKEIQEYYTESITRNDIISHIVEISQCMLSKKMHMEAITQYNKMYNLLNYYRMVIVEDAFINFQIYEFIKAVKSIETETEMINYHHQIFHAIYNNMYQTYLYSVTDLSYCRLSKNDLIYRIGLNDTLQMYYRAIYENKYLNEIEKARVYNRLFDSLRMSELNERAKIKPNNIETFLQKKSWNDNEEIVQLPIKCEPIALMFLEMFELKDIENISLFMKMNLESRTIQFVKILCILSISSMILKGNQKIYLNDLNIDEDKTIEIIQKLNFNIFELKENAIEFEEIILSFYSEESAAKGDKSKPYFFNPRLNFPEKVIKTYFYSKGLIDNNQCDEIILEIFNRYI